MVDPRGKRPNQSHNLGRLAFLSSERYARRMYQRIRYRRVRTGWIRRITAIDSKFSAGTERHAATGERQRTRTTRTEITAKEMCLWQEAMKKKRSLARHREHKSAPAPYHHYWGDRGFSFVFALIFLYPCHINNFSFYRACDIPLGATALMQKGFGATEYSYRVAPIVGTAGERI